MARTMKKFSAGGAQGRYDRRMADIEKDRKIALAKGKNADVVAAKAAQRIADAKDDLAKRTGADRTATRAAERAAESNLTKTRKYGAPKAVTATAPAPEAKVASVSGPIKSELASKPKTFGEAFKEARARLGAGKTFTFNGKSYTTNIAGEGRKPTQRPAATATTPKSAATTPKPAATTPKPAATTPKPAATVAPGTIALLQASKAAREKKEAEERKKRIGMPAYERMAKGGSVKKETTMKKKSTPPQPSAADRAADAKFRKSVKDIKVTPENAAAIGRGNRSSGYAKGGKATKFGAAMVKKSADTKGRAMVKKAGGGKCYAKGGSVSSASKRADGCAVKGKTKGTMLARGGAAMMRGRDSYGGANFKKGGSC